MSKGKTGGDYHRNNKTTAAKNPFGETRVYLRLQKTTGTLGERLAFSLADFYSRYASFVQTESKRQGMFTLCSGSLLDDNFPATEGSRDVPEEFLVKIMLYIEYIGYIAISCQRHPDLLDCNGRFSMELLKTMVDVDGFPPIGSIKSVNTMEELRGRFKEYDSDMNNVLEFVKVWKTDNGCYWGAEFNIKN